MEQEPPPDHEVVYRRFHQAEYAEVVAHLCHLGFAHHIADEAAAEALVQLYRSWFKVHSNKHMWVRTTAYRLAIRAAKAEKWPIRLLSKGFCPPSHDDSGFGEVVERHGGLVRAINSLPARQRVAFALHLAGFTAKEIAEDLNVKERTVHDRIRKARAALRTKLVPGEDI
ncbi:RNA polymerase sigma factor [Lentzea sp. NPDC059081]|uniref:RNA polymerase sigma factor n=1 Tax=Lentzea sp. NPDC059081 TaxID=3346719 RepID=UPI0036AF70A5